MSHCERKAAPKNSTGMEFDAKPRLGATSMIEDILLAIHEVASIVVCSKKFPRNSRELKIITENNHDLAHRNIFFLLSLIRSGR